MMTEATSGTMGPQTPAPADLEDTPALSADLEHTGRAHRNRLSQCRAFPKYATCRGFPPQREERTPRTASDVRYRGRRAADCRPSLQKAERATERVGNRCRMEPVR